jgi:predicted ABC-type ATPase
VPLLTIIAGPNGSGKSTLTKSVDFDGLERLLDPDAVARALNPMNPAAAAIAAGREVLKTIDSYLGSGVSFAVETTLSGKGNLDLIDTALGDTRSTWSLLGWILPSDPFPACAAERRGEATSFRMPM